MARLDAVRDIDGPLGATQRFQTGKAPDGPTPVRADAGVDMSIERPEWLSKAPHETLRHRRTPSDLVSHDAQGGIGHGRDQALLKGSAVHAILERLVDLPPDRRPGAAADLLSKEFPNLDPALRIEAVLDAEAVLALPEAAKAFGPDTLAEVSVAISDGPDRPAMLGRIDRLWIGPDHVEIIDIKTDAQPPADPKDIPRAYLAQLGAYQDGLATDWPDMEIRLSIVWTSIPAIMHVPSGLARDAFSDVR